ncbi:DUF2786 domain-containing protein [Actinopolymorpha sp. B17G11]|uniref:DUF2786 domain-containing protein n=1 Tax=Actinopolymorpha sp. B17G11 TaxID=3160861 RepID=UPI0032E4C21B
MTTNTAPIADKRAAMLERVRKMLALAEDPAATPAEAEECTRKAAILMAKYSIDAATVAPAGAHDHVDNRLVHVPGPFASDKALLLVCIADALRCSHLWKPTMTEDGKQLFVHLFGHTTDLEQVDMLWTSLLVQSQHAMAMATPRRGESKAAFKRSFLSGFAMGVKERLEGAEREATARATTTTRDGRSAAMVLTDRKALAQRAMREVYPNTRRTGVSRSGSGGFAGHAAGRNANMGGGQVSGRRAISY